jgi:hypothetical protein
MVNSKIINLDKRRKAKELEKGKKLIDAKLEVKARNFFVDEFHLWGNDGGRCDDCGWGPLPK